MPPKNKKVYTTWLNNLFNQLATQQYTGPVLRQVPAKWQQQQYEKEATAAQYVQQQKENRENAMNFFVNPAIAALFSPEYAGYLAVAEMLNGAGGVMQQIAKKKNWSASNSKAKRAFGKLSNTKGFQPTQMGLSTLVDVGQAFQDPADYTNYAELGLDGAQWLGYVNWLKRIPKYGNKIDKIVDWVGDKQPWVDAVVKPASKAVWQMLPQQYKDYIEYSSQLQQAAEEANRQAEVAGYR